MEVAALIFGLIMLDPTENAPAGRQCRRHSRNLVLTGEQGRQGIMRFTGVPAGGG
jgi:hypothetical protein